MDVSIGDTSDSMVQENENISLNIDKNTQHQISSNQHDNDNDNEMDKHIENNTITSLPLSSSTSDDLSIASMVAIHQENEDHNNNDDDNNNDKELDNQQDDIERQIIHAAQRGDVEFLKHYLSKDNDNNNNTLYSPNLTDSDGITLVHWAALNNKLTTVKYLVSIGANPDVKAGDMNATPLLWAVRYGLVYIADYLIRDAKVNVNAIDKNGINILLASVFSSNVMMVIYSIWAINQYNNDGELKNIGLDGINFTDPMGRTALHWAAYQGDFLSVDVLLNAQAEVNLIDADGFTPLHWALCNGSKAVITSLLEFQSNIDLKTNDGKSCWDIAKDMNCSTMWNNVLKENGRDPITGIKMVTHLTVEWANFLIFVLPYITLPEAIYVLTLNIQIILKILAILLIIITQQILLKQILIPSLKKGKVNLMRTSFFAGVFSSTAYWCIITWIFKILPKTIGKSNIFNFLFLLSATGTIYYFIKSSNMDPGCISKETNVENIQSTIINLLNERKFDSNNYCIYSNIRKPLRSKFSKEKKLNIARFDHYCPWVNNNIGVRNHKLFFAFVVFLEFAVISWLNLALNYFEDVPLNGNNITVCYFLPHGLCSASNSSKFLFYFFFWVSLQLFWLTILLLVQSIQISKGFTTYEFSHKYKHSHQGQEDIFASVPADDPLNILLKTSGVGNRSETEIENNFETMNDDNDDDEDDIDEIKTNLFLSFFDNVSQTLKKSKFIAFPIIFITKLSTSKLCRMVGFDQMVLITNDLMHRKKIDIVKEDYNYGWKNNWKDFLFLIKAGDNCSFRTLMATPVGGENNLNGYLVDYYTLYHKPETV